MGALINPEQAAGTAGTAAGSFIGGVAATTVGYIVGRLSYNTVGKASSAITTCITDKPETQSKVAKTVGGYTGWVCGLVGGSLAAYYITKQTNVGGYAGSIAGCSVIAYTEKALATAAGSTVGLVNKGLGSLAKNGVKMISGALQADSGCLHSIGKNAAIKPATIAGLYFGSSAGYDAGAYSEDDAKNVAHKETIVKGAKRLAAAALFGVGAYFYLGCKQK